MGFRGVLAVLGMVLLAAAGCVPGGGSGGGTAAAPDCVALFRDLDRAQRAHGLDSLSLGPEDRAVADPNLSRPVRLLRGGCITRVEDLGGLRQAEAALAPFARVRGGGAAVPRQSVHAGVVDGFTALGLARSYFNGLGYRTRSVGVDGLGRRLYVGGPFTSAEEVAQALDAARRAGFVHAYATEFPRF